MGDDKPSDPKRRQFLEDFFVNLGREAGKAYKELRKANRVLTDNVEELRQSVEQPLPSEPQGEPDPDPIAVAQRLNEIDEDIEKLTSQMRALVEREATPQSLTDDDRELLRQLLERLPQHKDDLTAPQSPTETEEVAQRRRALGGRLNELIKLVAVWLAARSPDVLFETLFGDEIWPRVKGGLQWLFDDAEAAGIIEKSPLPTPTGQAPHPPSVDIPQSLETPKPVETPTPAETPRPPRRQSRRDRDYPDFLPVAAGEFLMGSDKHRDKDAWDDELPQHRLYLPAYRMARTPVTVAQFAVFVKDTNHVFNFRQDLTNKRDHPVTYVSWHDARTYCEWLSQELNQVVRLPTEAEWEKAARGTNGRIYPWGNNVPNDNLCNFSESKIGDTTPVGKYPAGASPYGCLDMAGNVWEWTSSLQMKYPYDAKDGREDPDSDAHRVLRGGSFGLNRRLVRCAYRLIGGPDIRFVNLGFRVLSPGI